MKFADFPERNVLIAEKQDEYITLPAHLVGDKQGTAIIKLEFTEEEAKEFLKTRSIYISVWTFGNPFPPINASIKSPFPYTQRITDHLNAIYLKDEQVVNMYLADGSHLKEEKDLRSGLWKMVTGIVGFDMYRIFDDGRGNLFFNLTRDGGKTGLSTMLHPQFIPNGK